MVIHQGTDTHMRKYIFVALAAMALANVVTSANAETEVRDHRAQPIVRDHRQQPIVRDHRDQPEVRDHRHLVPIRW